ncbi:MAG TPA: EAL domain-containing protein [Gemmatimonadales bacterium]|nr:EAL domain-containing protein [Gemmatimonadales bacterium]
MTLLLDRILAPEGIAVVFQPVVEIAGGAMRLHGLECLSRGPQASNAARADVLFEYVRRKRMESPVDRACILVALREAARLPGAPQLSLNVHASTLGRDRDFPNFLEVTANRHDIDPARLTVEIVEHTQHWDGVTFDGALRALRAMGVRIALDDVGLGHSNYRMMLDSQPDYLKVDRYFVHGARDDGQRRTVLDSIAQLAAKLGARTVGEGVEDAADLGTLRDFGIDLAQGNLLARPLAAEQLVASGWLDAPVSPMQHGRQPQTAA